MIVCTSIHIFVAIFICSSVFFNMCTREYTNPWEQQNCCRGRGCRKDIIELHAPNSSTQKLKLMGKGGQFTYTPTLPLTCRLLQAAYVEYWSGL
jgi:hypothetical protein